MNYISFNCPTCKKHDNLNIHAANEYKIFSKKEIKEAKNNLRKHGIHSTTKIIDQNDIIKSFCTGLCKTCGQPVFIIFTTEYRTFDMLRRDSKNEFNNFSDRIDIVSIFPEAPKPYFHDSIPKNIIEKFEAAFKVHNQGIDPNLVITACRGVLELILNDLGASGNRIVDKIEDLFNKNIISETLKDWSHQIRLDGNKGVHEMNCTEEDAEQVMEFTKILLEYVYVLPAKIIIAKQS